MTRALFGTDGVRGRVNRHPMTPEVCVALGRAVALTARAARTARGSARSAPTVVIGRDTRGSGPMLEGALSAGLQSAGADVVLAGVVPTPAVAFLTRELRADAGLVISASHNPFFDNGVKVFGADGFKLTDAQEAELEALVAGEAMAETAVVEAEAIGSQSVLDDAIGRYATFVKRAFRVSAGGVGGDLGGLRLLVDCAHGACHRVAPMVLSELGAQVVPMGTAPTGRNINDGVGATAPEAAARAVREGLADLALAFDGDGDRLIVVDERGQVVDGDEVLAIGAVAMKERGALRGGGIVATVMSNLGLQMALAERGIALFRCPVGDRYVVEAMRERGCNYGGEQSGHVVHLDVGTTGDGLATALLLLAELRRSGRPLAELRRVMERFPQALVNVPVSHKPPLETLDDVQVAIGEAEQSMGQRGRVLVRYSGTEPKARVMVEADEPQQVERWVERIAAVLAEAIGER